MREWFSADSCGNTSWKYFIQLWKYILKTLFSTISCINMSWWTSFSVEKAAEIWLLACKCTIMEYAGEEKKKDDFNILATFKLLAIVKILSKIYFISLFFSGLMLIFLNHKNKNYLHETKKLLWCHTRTHYKVSSFRASNRKCALMIAALTRNAAEEGMQRKRFNLPFNCTEHTSFFLVFSCTWAHARLMLQMLRVLDSPGHTWSCWRGVKVQKAQ